MTTVNKVNHDLITLMSVLPWKDNDYRLTKKWLSDGRVDGYNAGAFFSCQTVEVSGIVELSKLLTSLEADSSTAIMRSERKPITEISKLTRPGKTAEAKPMKAVPRTGVVRHWNECFNSLPYHFILIDIDHFKPEDVDPIAYPEKAVDQYVAKFLPDCFQGASYHWQLSASAGHADYIGVLKAHVWFWLETPYTSTELKAWADATNLELLKDVIPKPENNPIDPSPYKTNQFHYTADPIFEDGVINPVEVRSGLYEGWIDTVYLVIDDVTLLRAAEVAKKELADSDYPDPCLKKGIFGAINRAIDIDTLFSELLADYIDHQPGALRFSLIGATPDGGWIESSHQQMIGCSNDSWPSELKERGGLSSKFDVLRVLKFGHLDEGVDRFEYFNDWDLPSYKAALSFFESLPEVQAELEAEKTESVQTKIAALQDLEEMYETKINQAMELHTLELVVCREIANDRSLSRTSRDNLTGVIQERTKEISLSGRKTPIGLVRAWVKPAFDAGIDVDRDSEGNPLLTISSVNFVLGDMRATVRYNTMTKEDEILIPGKSFSMANASSAALAHIVSACAEVGLSGTSTIMQYLTAIADANLYSPVMTWITSKPWDGVSRLQDLYNTLTVAPDHVAIRDAFLRKWLLSAVVVQAKPEGAMVRGVLVLSGAQNKGKSRWVQSLAPLPNMVCEGHLLDPKDKDSVKIAISAWITELGELDATFNKADNAAIKGFITKRVDKFRRPYAPTESSYPRQTVFVGTVNESAYLKDPTGSTRFWTIPVQSIEHGHAIDMQQLWAEVYESMYLKGGVLP